MKLCSHKTLCIEGIDNARTNEAILLDIVRGMISEAGGSKRFEIRKTAIPPTRSYLACIDGLVDISPGASVFPKSISSTNTRPSSRINILILC